MAASALGSGPEAVSLAATGHARKKVGV